MLCGDLNGKEIQPFLISAMAALFPSSLVSEPSPALSLYHDELVNAGQLSSIYNRFLSVTSLPPSVLSPYPKPWK